MKKDKIAEQLSDILPNRPIIPGNVASSAQLIDKEATCIKAKQDAKEVARIKYLEKQKLARLKAKEAKRQSLAEELGLDSTPNVNTDNQLKKIAEQTKRVEAIEAIEAQVSPSRTSRNYKTRVILKKYNFCHAITRHNKTRDNKASYFTQYKS